jgi:pyruvate kinase
VQDIEDLQQFGVAHQVDFIAASFVRKASDIDYYYQSRLRGEVAGVNDVHFHPVEPRTVRLTLSTGF